MKRAFAGAAVGVLIMIVAIGGVVIATQRGWLRGDWLGALARGHGLSGFCKEHGVPERFCTLCHDELNSTLAMCREHGLPEEICTVCHPEAEQKYDLTMMCAHRLPGRLCVQCRAGSTAATESDDWCSTHSLPKTLCTRCEPQLAERLTMCREHAVPEALCTICRPVLARNFALCRAHGLPQGACPRCLAAGDSGHGGRAPSSLGADAMNTAGSRTPPLSTVRLAGADVAENFGVRTTPVQTQHNAPIVIAQGEVGYDETQLAHVRPPVAGVVRELRVRTGDVVEPGQVLAVVDSSDLGQAKADYLAAAPMVELWTETVARTRGLGERGSIAGKQILEAETELRRAKADVIKASQRLRNLGLDRHQIARLTEEPEDERNRLSVVAPIGGTIVRAPVVAGEVVEAMSELATIANLDRMWVHLAVYDKDLRLLRVGQSVRFRVDGLGPTEFTGAVTWIDSEVRPDTRTIRVRAEIDNGIGLLKAHMFGRGEIQVGQPRSSMVVPRDAVQWEGRSYVVFVQRSPAEFEPRRVLVGQGVGPMVELAWANLSPGEQVVASGSFLLKSEVLKESIGPGCCAPE
jgi:cobalt-zinc-cadmium efflux system membrane fusion protein